MRSDPTRLARTLAVGAMTMMVPGLSHAEPSEAARGDETLVCLRGLVVGERASEEAAQAINNAFCARARDDDLVGTFRVTIMADSWGITVIAIRATANGDAQSARFHTRTIEDAIDRAPRLADELASTLPSQKATFVRPPNTARAPVSVLDRLLSRRASR